MEGFHLFISAQPNEPVSAWNTTKFVILAVVIVYSLE